MSRCMQVCLLRNLLWWLLACLGFFLTTWILTAGDVAASVTCGVTLLVLGSAAVVWTCHKGCQAAESE